MPKPTDLDKALAANATDFSCYGRQAANRFDDEDLERLRGRSLEKLCLLRQHLTKLPPLEPTLSWMWLGDTSTLTSLDGIEQLVSLQTLWLTEVPNLDLDRVFEQLAELPELGELRLGGASFKKMPAGVAKLPSLMQVMLEDCAGLDVGDALAKLGASKTLRNVKLYIKAELHDVLAPLARIEELYVHGMWGKTFSPSIGKLTKLVKLELDRCEFEALPDELCKCSALEELDVGDIGLKSFPDDIGKLSKLRVLKANGNKKMKTLPASIGSLANLRELWLPWNERLVVPDSLFALKLEKFHGPSKIEAKMTLAPPPTPQEDRVWLSDVDRIPADFGDPKDLEIAFGDYAEPLPQLSKLRRLEELTIQYGNLDDAFTRLASAPKLRELKINGEYKELPDSLGGLVCLKTLVIDTGDQSYPDNPGLLKALPDAIGELTELETLQLERHALTKLPAAIGKLTKLKKLEFEKGSGKIKRLPAELVKCTALEEFSVWRGCGFENLDLLGKLPALKKVSIHDDDIAYAKLFDALAQAPIEVLDMRWARIKTLPASIGKLTKLRRLELSRSDIKMLPKELLKCTELRYISFPLYNFDSELRDKLKEHLPKGRWKKGDRSGEHWYERSD